MDIKNFNKVSSNLIITLYCIGKKCYNDVLCENLWIYVDKNSR